MSPVSQAPDGGSVVNADAPTAHGRSFFAPARLVVLCLPPLLAFLPPETRGESMTGIALLIGLLSLIAWRRATGDESAHALFVLGAGMAAVFAMWAAVPAAAVEPLAVAALAAAAGLAAFWSGLDERDVRRTLLILAAASAGVALYGIYQKLWGLEAMAEVVRQDPTVPDRLAVLTRLGRGRAFAWFATPAALGGFLAISTPTALGLALSSRGRIRSLLFGVTGIGVVALLASASATASAALLIAVALAGIAWTRAWRGLLVAGAALALVLLGTVWLRGGRIVDLDDPEGPWRLRAGNLRAAAAMVADHPWSGVGPGGFASAYPAYRQPGDNETRHAHHLPLELAAEWGVPVGVAWTLLFFGLFLGPLWKERGNSPAWRRGTTIGLAAFAVQNLGDFTAFMPSLLWTAALLRGVLASPVSTGHRGCRPPNGGGLLAAASLALIMVAAGVSAMGGLAANARTVARVAAFAGEIDAAERLADRATRLAPWHGSATLLHARLLTDAALRDAIDPVKLELAGPVVERAVRIEPVSAAARQLRAKHRLGTGDLPGAFADLSEAARLYPAHPEYAAERDRLARRIAPGEGRSR